MPVLLSQTPEGKSKQRLVGAIQSGYRVVRYPYVVSFIFITLRLQSPPYLVPPNDRSSGPGKYSLLSMFAGWWGIPFGPIYTLQALASVNNGGKDVSDEYCIRRGSSKYPCCRECGHIYSKEEGRFRCESCFAILPQD